MTEPSGITEVWKGGHHQATRRVPGAAPAWAALGALLADLWVPSAPTSAYIYTPSGNPRKRNPFSRNPLCSAAAAVSRSGLPGEAASAPCRKEKPPPGDHP